MRQYLQERLSMSKGVKRFIASESLLGIAIGLFVLVFNLHLLDLGFSEKEIGTITSLGTLIIGIFSIPIGLLGNYLGRKKMLVTGLALMGFGYIGIGFGTGALMIYASQITISIGITFLITSEIQLLFHYSRSKKEETMGFSMLFAVFTLFTGVGTLFGGFLPDLLGGKTTVYQSTIIIAGLFILLGAFIRGVILPKEEYKAHTKSKLTLSGLKTQLLNKKIWNLSIYTFVIGASYAIVIPYLNIVLKFRFDWGDGLISLLLAINGIFLFLGSIFMPFLLERWGSNKTYLIMYLSTISVTILLFFNIPVSLFSILLLTRGGTMTMLSNMINSQTMQAIEEEDRNLFAGMRAVFQSSGSALASLIAGFILGTKNYSLPFLLSGLLLLLGYLYFIFLVKPVFEKENIL